MLRPMLLGLSLALALLLGGGAVALATPSPNGPGQPGAPATTCNPTDPTSNTFRQPGASSTAQGSPFDPNGTAGAVYAGNPGTASLAHANSPLAVSQYDIACFQVTTP